MNMANNKNSNTEQQDQEGSYENDEITVFQTSLSDPEEEMVDTSDLTPQNLARLRKADPSCTILL
jgi:hypothetical protein